MNTLDRLTDYSVDMDAENIMDVRTEKLDPIVSSNYRYTFRLDTSSYLDKNTMLLFNFVFNTIQFTYLNNIIHKDSLILIFIRFAFIIF